MSVRRLALKSLDMYIYTHRLSNGLDDPYEKGCSRRLRQKKSLNHLSVTTIMSTVFTESNALSSSKFENRDRAYNDSIFGRTNFLPQLPEGRFRLFGNFNVYFNNIV